jgi:undecaprenyl-diphosphatase
MGWALLLAIAVLQGLTEFLPVSSSGHLTVAAEVFDLGLWGRDREAFFVLLHGASLLAVLVGLAGAWRRHLARGAIARTLAIGVLGSLPAAAAGLGLRAVHAEGLFESLPLVGVAWLATAGLLWSTARTTGRAGVDVFTADALPARIVLLVGVAQAVAIVPGISRSGATIAVALLLGVQRRVAFELSFLLAIPAIGGALLLDAGELTQVSATAGPGALAAAFALALVVSLAALKALGAVVERERLHGFAPYCALAGLATLVFVAVR